MAELPTPGRALSEEEIYKNFHQYDFDANAGFISGWKKIRDKTEPARYEQELLRAKLFFYSRTIEKVDKEEYERWLTRYHSKGNKDGGTSGSDVEIFTYELGNAVDSGKGDNSIQTSIPANDHIPLRIQMKSDYVNLRDRPDDQITSDLEEKITFCGTDNMEQEQTENTCKSSALDKDVNVLKGCNSEKAGEMYLKVHVNHDTEKVAEYRGKNSASNYPGSFSELISLLESGCKIPGIEELNVEPTNENPTPSALDRKRKPWEK